MKSWLGRIAIVVFIAMTACGLAWAQSTPPGGNTVPKVALVIGNSKYQENGYSLRNPGNDAQLMDGTLKKLGFTVTTYLDLGRADLVQAVQRFAAEVPEGATTFVFYAGHGMQLGEANFLVPTDMRITSEQSAAMRAVPLATVFDALSASRSAVNIVVLDACRNNPFRPKPDAKSKMRSFEGLGLAPVAAPRGTLIAYSTSPYQQAPDGKGDNSTYTEVLAATLVKPSMSLEGIFKAVGEQVRQKTLDDQIPWVSSDLADAYYFKPPAGVTVVAGKNLKNDKGLVKVAMRGIQTDFSVQPSSWYRKLNEADWTNLDWEIQNRVKKMTPDEIEELEHRASGGNVLAQTTLGLAWSEGIDKATTSDGKIIRHGANNSKARYWLEKAAQAKFPIAETLLGEMYGEGRGGDKNLNKAIALLKSASNAKYPRAKLDLAHLNMMQGQTNMDELSGAIKSAMDAYQQQMNVVQKNMSSSKKIQ